MAETFIGNYRILKKVGAGGMAQVYLAVHKDIPNLKVVLKVLSDPRLVERFRQEADKLALLDGHGHICQIKHFFNHGEDIVIAMEYIDGTTPDALIEEKGPLSVNESIRVISDVLDTLEFAHQKGIFHRDIKPSNIMVDRDGQVKIIDFGIAKAKTDPNLTIAGSACGTPAYMPPEQFNPTDEINYALADIYAAGTSLFFMLTGRLPFTGDNPFALRDAKLFNDPIKPREMREEIPKKLEDIILKALSKNPEDRYASASEMRQAISAVKIDSDPKTAGLTVEIKKVRAPKGQKKGGAVRIIVPIVVMACLVAAYFLFFGGEDGPAPEHPRLLSPEAGVTVNSSALNFTWEATGERSRNFALKYANDPDFINSQTISDVSGTSYTFSEELSNGEYFWQVIAYNDAKQEIGRSMIQSFMVESESESTSLPVGFLEISVNPNGDIYIDDELYGSDEKEVTIDLDTGQHIIRVANSKSIQKEIRKTVYLLEDSTESLNFEFSFQPAEPVQAYGRVVVGSKPIDGGIVFIDGNVQDRRTNNTFKLTTGIHYIKVVLTLDGKELEKVDSVMVEKDITHKKMFNFEE
jgi:serine/threonine-protein kinase